MPKRKRDIARSIGNKKRREKRSEGKWKKACKRSSVKIIVNKNRTEIVEADSESFSYLKDQDLNNLAVSPVQTAEQTTHAPAWASTVVQILRVKTTALM